MTQNVASALLILGVFFVGALVVRFGWRRVFIGKPNVQLMELGAIRPDPETWDMIGHASPGEGMHRMQISDDTKSIIYTWSDRAETLDVSVEGKAGIVVTWSAHAGNERVITRLTNVGGSDFRFPRVTTPERVAADKLLRRVRAIFRAGENAR